MKGIKKFSVFLALVFSLGSYFSAANVTAQHEDTRLLRCAPQTDQRRKLLKRRAWKSVEKQQ